MWNCGFAFGTWNRCRRRNNSPRRNGGNNAAMAKSLRSKWKRKMRAEKRVRYGAKERAKLVKMVEDTNKAKEEKEREEEHRPQPLGDDSGEQLFEVDQFSPN